ncbi:hypothetical protein F0P96_15940 [Hymenobacter busanensis]|uniref:Uncharacterized protein n=1 Tax=Hymenobacter busanensis TaxID=2607656 RepID=A0A7L4ZXL8_9BACT|nr:DUF6756 family protein [Hymenobacter busanensis]KAA9327472.1 hypothetical protein F0P96_15940 [Hymenobacter busanensis]QHJ06190.1 hypothetical protein GUY19_02295 [Hymenobacter busanensis]
MMFWVDRRAIGIALILNRSAEGCELAVAFDFVRTCAGMWPPVRNEIEKLRQMPDVQPEHFCPLGAHEWLVIEGKVEDAFRQPVQASKRKSLLWTQLRSNLAVAVLSYVDADETALVKLRKVWPAHEPVFFFAQESITEPKKWWYRTKGAVAWQLLKHVWQKPTPVEEWGIVDRKYRWALFVTHADDIIFCGQPLVDRVLQLGQQANIRIR